MQTTIQLNAMRLYPRAGRFMPMPATSAGMTPRVVAKI
jgi:hypothetical protein